MYVCRVGIDEWLRVPSVPDVFAIGDCSGYLESTGKATLPALAQVSGTTFHVFSYSFQEVCHVGWVMGQYVSLLIHVTTDCIGLGFVHLKKMIHVYV